MSSVRGRRPGVSAAGRRSTGRPLARAASRPLSAGERAGDRAGSAVRPAPRPSRRRLPRVTAGAPARRPLLTGRAVALAGVVLLLALTVAGPIRQYLGGRTQIADLAAQGTQLQQRVDQLRAQLAEQADPAWAERQARQRLTYVLPGDRLITVVDGQAVSGDAGTVPTTPQHAHPVPWYEGLMQSIATADRGRAGGDKPHR